MLILFFVELSAFLTHRTETMVVLDPGLEQQVRAGMQALTRCWSCNIAVSNQQRGMRLCFIAHACGCPGVLRGKREGCTSNRSY